jgi:hypothetical protein
VPSLLQRIARAVSVLGRLERPSGTIRRAGSIGYHDHFDWCPDRSRLFVVDDVDAVYALSIVDHDGAARRHVRNLNTGDEGGLIDLA